MALLCVAALCMLPAAGVSSLDIAVGMSLSDVSFGEALMAAGVASLLGFDTHVVLYYHDAVRLPYPAVVTSLLLARVCGADHHRITAWRTRGHGCGRIAKDLGVHPGTFNMLRKGLDVGRVSDDEFERLVMRWYISQHYGVAPDRVYGWERGGQPFLGIVIALDLGAKSHRPVSDLFSARKRLPSWHAVADRVGVGKSTRMRAQPPRGGREYRAKAPRAGKGPGAAVGPRERGAPGQAKAGTGKSKGEVKGKKGGKGGGGPRH